MPISIVEAQDGAKFNTIKEDKMTEKEIIEFNVEQSFTVHKPIFKLVFKDKALQKKLEERDKLYFSSEEDAIKEVKAMCKKEKSYLQMNLATIINEYHAFRHITGIK